MTNRIEQIVASGTPVTQANRDRAVLGDRYDEFAAVNAALARHDAELSPEDFVAMTADRGSRKVRRSRPSRSAVNRVLAMYFERV